MTNNLISLVELPRQHFLCSKAKGNLEIIKWLTDNRYDTLYPHTAETAARQGKIEAVRWILENGKKTREPEVCSESAFSGNLNLLKWLLLEKNFDYYKTSLVMKSAESGKTEMFRWVLTFVCECTKNPSTCECLRDIVSRKKLFLAASRNHDTLRFCRNFLNFRWRPEILKEVIQHGKLKTLRWIVRNGCPVDLATVKNAFNIGWSSDAIAIWLVDEMDDEVEKWNARRKNRGEGEGGEEEVKVEKGEGGSDRKEGEGGREKGEETRTRLGQKIFEENLQALRNRARNQDSMVLVDWLDKKGIVWYKYERDMMKQCLDPRIRRKGEFLEHVDK